MSTPISDSQEYPEKYALTVGVQHGWASDEQLERGSKRYLEKLTITDPNSEVSILLDEFDGWQPTKVGPKEHKVWSKLQKILEHTTLLSEDEARKKGRDFANKSWSFQEFGSRAEIPNFGHIQTENYYELGENDDPSTDEEFTEGRIPHRENACIWINGREGVLFVEKVNQGPQEITVTPPERAQQKAPESKPGRKGAER